MNINCNDQNVYFVIIFYKFDFNINNIFVYLKLKIWTFFCYQLWKVNFSILYTNLILNKKEISFNSSPLIWSFLRFWRIN